MTLSIVLMRKEDNVIGRNDRASSYEAFPGLGMKTTLAFLHSAGTYPRRYDTLYSLVSLRRACGPKCLRTRGFIPSGPAAFRLPNVFMASDTFSSVMKDAVWSFTLQVPQS